MMYDISIYCSAYPCMHTCLHVCMYACTNAYIHTYMHTHTHTHTYTHTHTHTHTPSLSGLISAHPLRLGGYAEQALRQGTQAQRRAAARAQGPDLPTTDTDRSRGHGGRDTTSGKDIPIITGKDSNIITNCRGKDIFTITGRGTRSTPQ